MQGGSRSHTPLFHWMAITNACVTAGMQGAEAVRLPEPAAPLQHSSSAHVLSAVSPRLGISPSRSPSPRQRRHHSASSSPSRGSRRERSATPPPAEAAAGAEARSLAVSPFKRGGSAVGDGKAPAVFLEDLRQRLGRPRPSTELEDLVAAPAAPQGGGGAPASSGGRAVDAAGLAAALAARLSASPSLLYRR